MSEPKPKADDVHSVAFLAPRDLVAKLDALAEREFMSRATLRRLAAQATQEAAA